MRQLVTGEQMKAVDQYAIQEVGIPSLVLMERAALSVVEEMEPELFREDQILIACGTGNNGADGAAVRRMLLSTILHNLQEIDRLNETKDLLVTQLSH